MYLLGCVEVLVETAHVEERIATTKHVAPGCPPAEPAQEVPDPECHLPRTHQPSVERYVGTAPAEQPRIESVEGPFEQTRRDVSVGVNEDQVPAAGGGAAGIARPGDLPVSLKDDSRTASRSHFRRPVGRTVIDNDNIIDPAGNSAPYRFQDLHQERNADSHDECADAIAVQADEPYNGTTAGATGTDTSSCSYEDTLDVWHCFTAKYDYEYISRNNWTCSGILSSPYISLNKAYYFLRRASRTKSPPNI